MPDFAVESGTVTRGAPAKTDKALAGHSRVTVHTYSGVDHTSAYTKDLDYNTTSAGFVDVRMLACFERNLR